MVTVPEDHEEEPKKATPEAEGNNPRRDPAAASQAGLRPGPGCLGGRNDRNLTHNGVDFQDIPHLKKELPRQFDDATNRTIELKTCSGYRAMP